MANKKITDKFDAYDHFLDALIANLERTTSEYEKRRKLYIIIKELLRKKKTGELVSSEEYAKLTEICCPEVDLLELFSGSAEMTAEGILVPNFDKLLWLCPGLSCSSCWENFINLIAETINKSETMVKNIEPLDEDNNSDKKYVSFSNLFKNGTKEEAEDNHDDTD